MRFFDYAKNLFILLIFLQLTPALLQGIRTQYSRFLLPSTRVGVIKLHGTLSDSSWYAKQLHTFFKDPDIKAILLKIESGGSAAGTGAALCNEISILKKQYPKPIITLTENTCASGAYYIACATDYIIASGQAIVGSIGSYIPYLFQVNGLLNDYHVQYEAIQGGAFKTTTDPFVPLNEEGKAQLQGVVDDSYAQFVADVAQHRKLALAQADVWANGKLFTGKQALALSLIDALGSASTAVAYIKDKKLIDGEIEWIHAEPNCGWFGQLFAPNVVTDEHSVFSAVGKQVLSCIQSIRHIT